MYNPTDCFEVYTLQMLTSKGIYIPQVESCSHAKSVNNWVQGPTF